MRPAQVASRRPTAAPVRAGSRKADSAGAGRGGRGPIPGRYPNTSGRVSSRRSRPGAGGRRARATRRRLAPRPRPGGGTTNRRAQGGGSPGGGAPAPREGRGRRATGGARAAGRIDGYRAQLIAEATSVLPEDLARRVEEQILPGAGEVTVPRLRQRLGYAVIAADPEGAEQRRKDAEQHAEMRLFAGDDQTATLMLTRQPQVEAAASFARVTALARARMAAGIGGTLNFHRSQVALGLLLGTLPPMPPAEGAPPDQPPPGDPPEPDDGAGPDHDP